MSTAIVRYSAGQTDDEGNPVSTHPFEVEFDDTRVLTLEASIADTGDVRFNWELLRVIRDETEPSDLRWDA